MKLTSKIIAGFFFGFLPVFFFPSCHKEDVKKTNQHAPVANAGTDLIIVLPSNAVTLNGSRSTDAENNISSYLWTKVAGPSSFTIVTANAVQTQVTDLVQGVYQFELKVTDGVGLFSKDTVQVFVIDGSNHPPVANAGPDKSIVLPTNSTLLDGSGSSDPDNNISSYQWRKLTGPSSFNIVTPNDVRTNVTSLDTGVYLFELKVIDAGGLFSKDTVRVDVNRFSGGQLPIANAGPDQALNFPVNSTTLDGSASHDPENSPLQYQWIQVNGPVQVTITNPNSAITNVAFPQSGDYEFELKVTDNTGLSSTDKVLIHVMPVNSLMFLNMTWVYDPVNHEYHMESPALTLQQINTINRVFVILHDFPFFGEYWAEAERNSTSTGNFYYTIQNNHVVISIDSQTGTWLIQSYNPDAMWIILN